MITFQTKYDLEKIMKEIEHNKAGAGYSNEEGEIFAYMRRLSKIMMTIIEHIEEIER